MRLIVLVLGDFSHEASEEAPGVESALFERRKQGACQLPNLHSRCVPNERIWRFSSLQPSFKRVPLTKLTTKRSSEVDYEVDYEAPLRLGLGFDHFII